LIDELYFGVVPLAQYMRYTEMMPLTPLP